MYMRTGLKQPTFIPVLKFYGLCFTGTENYFTLPMIPFHLRHIASEMNAPSSVNLFGYSRVKNDKL